MKSGLSNDPGLMKSLLVHSIDIGLVLALIYMVLVIIGERRTLWMVRGFIVLMLASALSHWAGLKLLSFALNSLVIGSAVSMAVILQSEFRRFLEQLGQGEILQMFGHNRRVLPESDSIIDEIVESIKQLSQNRIGALLIIETDGPIDERDFSVPGVKLNAELSKELLQTIFQPKTLLHDGAVLIREHKVISAGVILPLSERIASRQLGTRHRAAMGITEQVEKCLCVVVSEETGSISLAEKGTLNRPLTSNKLKELLEQRLFLSGSEKNTKPFTILNLGVQIGTKGSRLMSCMLRQSPPAPRKKR
ncbi:MULTISPECIES: diadenylate cyclase CdaA [Okeania]|uniref:Diadenylate cyclase n=1 Tax=Okeania hirsuta TaxID=1458930 RepID=A0A3N6NNF4_9CYAN|nr:MULTISPECIES: diadenylate cyclase CdaA [Okeania]NEP04088.1 TIGR00159 family protein [Okeania sp. SIO4D6]NEP40044.1 TIGR00159 family protein [Okeania sp. SIO2H7]NET12777.1 TIGR00159 family protein [Okeania sp. SIO1H6]NEP73346.1 TIGR00159 family protein [Okeania sp. SIO2G5]NEP94175.1 TIGR00159 family protein [Okeania sp. SIO2F5]